MKKYPKLKYPGNEKTEGLFADGTIYIQEKFDGGNGRFMLQDHLDSEYHEEDRDLVFGSRNVVYKNSSDETNQFADQVEFVRENVDVEKLREYDDGFDGIIIYGEYMEPHTLEYDWENVPPFLGFDVWSIGNEKFLHPDVTKNVIEGINLPFVEYFDVIEASGWSDYDLEIPKSKYGDVQAEGVVFKNPDMGVYGKWVREDFKEKNKEIFGKSKRHQVTGAEKVAYQYITEARIEKAIHKLVDEHGYDYEMKMMESLPEYVIRDMADEEAANLFMEESWEIDTAELRSIVSSRCASILKRVINVRAREQL